MKEISSNPIVSKLRDISFEFTGQVQSVTLSPGRYKLEVWGAAGGENKYSIYYGSYTGSAGRGGYSVGTLTLKTETKLHVFVGGCPNSFSGGWNGGGNAGPGGGAGGGGCTDISLFGKDGSDLWNNEEHLYSRIIVAGGGGGSAHSLLLGWFGGFGGGQNGGSNDQNSAKGGTQIDGSGFGFGGSSRIFEGSGGGGGWYGGWYGGYAYSYIYNCCGGGSGGSGFVYNSSTAQLYPDGCRLNSSFFLSESFTIPGNNEFPVTTGRGKEIGHQGNGFARITPL